jgi:hypothetical protein
MKTLYTILPIPNEMHLIEISRLSSQVAKEIEEIKEELQKRGLL